MTGGIRLAIVGSTSFKRKEAWWTAEEIIRQTIAHLQPVVLISGGAVGIDSLAKTIGRELGYSIETETFVEHLPEVRAWDPPGKIGFKKRNFTIAQDCTQLLRIACKDSTTYGSGWTADKAKGLGKPVEIVLL